MPVSRNANLDMVRGLAILLVLLFHFYRPTGLALDAVMLSIARTGWAGVDLFFVLSGFLVGRLILIEAERGQGLRYGRFFARRALRLWPALFGYLAALLLISGPDSWPQVWPVLLHIQNYSDATPDHLWSLAVEQHFYLVAALLLPALALRSPRHVFVALASVILICPLLRILALAAGVPLLAIQWQTPYRMDALAIGVLLGWCAVYRPDWLSRAGAHRLLLSMAAVAGYALLAVGDAGSFRHGIGFSIAALASAALIVAMLDARVPAIAKPAGRALAGLGTISYSLYLWHASLGSVAGAVALSVGWTHPLLVLAAKLIVSISVSIATYRLIEQPFLDLRNRRAVLRSGAQAPATIVEAIGR